MFAILCFLANFLCQANLRQDQNWFVSVLLATLHPASPTPTTGRPAGARTVPTTNKEDIMLTLSLGSIYTSVLSRRILSSAHFSLVETSRATDM